MKNIQIILTINIFLISCRSETINVLSTYDNGQVKEQLISGIDTVPKGYELKQIFHNDGTLKCQGTKLNDQRDGRWNCYSENGELEWTANYSQGTENGLTECFYSNGTWKKTNLVNGTYEGSTTEYNFDSLENTYFFVYGQYENNLEHGLWISKSADDKPRYIRVYKNGLKQGNFKQFHKNGTPSMVGKFLNDQLQDSILIYNDESKLVRIEIYDNGKIINEQKMK